MDNNVYSSNAARAQTPLAGRKDRDGMACRGVRLSNQVYANIVVDIQARELKDRLFTYRVPSGLVDETFIGAQVLVPFGPGNLVAGYVVALSEEQPNAAIAIKDVAEIIEPEPLFDRPYVEFLYWLADYYCSSISDVISAAIPTILVPKIRRVVRLSEQVRVGLREFIERAQDPASKAVLHILTESKSGALVSSVLRQRWKRMVKVPQSQFYRALNYLRQEGFITIDRETSETESAKTVTTLIWSGQEPTTTRQKEVVSVLIRHGGQMPLQKLLEEAKTSAGTVKRLVCDGVILSAQSEVLRDPLKNTRQRAPEMLTLTADQTQALAVLSQELERALAENAADVMSAESSQPWLLHGVTGSGKTEIYLQLIQKALDRGRSSLLLVPEISLTPQLASRLKSRFGSRVSVWHSALSDGERFDTWRRLRAGDVKVLLGARSAVLANLPDLGLIVLDEEHDGSYKQSSPAPRYHARDVAIERARRCGAMVLLGSATPDVCTYLSARANGRVLQLPERVFKQELPDVKIVDMRQEMAIGNRSIFSHTLSERLWHAVKQREQTILLINRRGYASHVFCRACGYVIKCRNCSVSMVFHQGKRAQSADGKRNEYLSGFLACHHCAYRLSAVELCPNCRSPFIRQFGLGTQRVEEEVRERFPDASVLRLDSDIATRRGAHEEILAAFAEGAADILIGTQMVAKGLDIPNVTLVGVLAADAAFNLPDYRSVERGFQLLTQVSGRAGRGQRPGSVILQTFDTDMPALQWARKHNYEKFFAEEIEARKTFLYPPFGQLIRLVVSGPEPLAVEAKCHQLAEEIGQRLEEVLPPDSLLILGPAPCLIERLRNNYRFHLLIKNLAGEQGRALVTDFLRQCRLPAGFVLAVDVDPLDLL